jgi:uncharacterized protein
MKISKYLILVILFILSITRIYSLEVPYLIQRVTDNANILSPEVVTELEKKLESHERNTSNQIAVLIIKSLEDEILEQFSMKVVETWKLGTKGKDNGVLLLIVLEDRKIRIEVGYGLEGSLTDAICNFIIRSRIVPRFKERNFDGGVKEGINAIISSVEGNSLIPEAIESTSGKKIKDIVSICIGVIVLLILAFFIIMILIWLFRFTFMTQGWVSWIFFTIFLPVYILIPWALIILISSNEYIWIWFFIIGGDYILMKLWFSFSKEGKRLCRKHSVDLSLFPTKFFSSGNWKTTSSSSSSFTSYRSSSPSWSSSSRSFSGGGGSFGGGGASGGW